jgi:hypothetical protein
MIAGMGIFIGCGYGSHTRIDAATLEKNGGGIMICKNNYNYYHL